MKGVIRMFADRLKQLRKTHGLSQDKLASALNNKYETNVSKSMISRWENSAADPQMMYVRMIADYFNVSAEYILGDSDSKTSSLKTADLADDDVIFTYQGKPLSEEDKELIRRIMNGK